MKIKRFTFGFGTVLSLIIAYFIYLYAAERGWRLLAFIAKAYLFIYLAIFALIVGVILFIGIIFLIAMLFLKRKMKFTNAFYKREYKNINAQTKSGTNYVGKEKIIDAEYKIKE